MADILTLEKGKLKKVNCLLNQGTVLGDQILLYDFDENNNLIIDSWNNLIDIIPKKYISSENRLCKVDRRYALTSKKEDLLKIILNNKREIDSEKNRRINIISLCPTFSCNLACTYCFERAFGINSNINCDSEGLIDTAKKFIITSQTTEPDVPVMIELFGGEPLQLGRRDFVQKCCNLVRSLSCGISIVSNGYNLFDFADLFVQYRDVIKNISVTLDGTEKRHNSLRITKDGSGTFAQISKSIDLILSLGLPIRVCTNIDKNSLSDLPGLLEYIEKSGWLNYKDFQVEIGRILDCYNVGNPNIIEEYKIQNLLLTLFGTEKPAWLHAGFVKSTEKPLKKLGAFFGEGEIGKGRFNYCWATSDIIRGIYLGPDGSFYRCTVTVGNPTYEVGKINNDDFYSYRDIWHQDIFSLPDRCLKCPIGGYCNGGCLIERNRKDMQEICNYELRNFYGFLREILIPQLKKRINKNE